jgi:hypothetical protein
MPEQDGKDQWDWSCEKQCVTYSQGRKELSAHNTSREGKLVCYMWSRKFLLKYVIQIKIGREDEE